MAEKKEFWNEKRLKSLIKWLVAGIVVVILAMAGWWYWLNRPQTGTPPLIQNEITRVAKEVKKNPEDIDARSQLAQLYIQSKQYDEAIAECQAVLKVKKDNNFVLYLIGFSYEQKNNTKAAISYYKRAIESGEKAQMSGKNPGYTNSIYQLGMIYVDQKKYKEAAELFKKAVAISPTDSDGLYGLGLAYIGTGDYDAAIENLKKAIRFVPNFAEAHYALGRAYEKKGDKAQAIKEYEAAVKYKPNYKEAEKALNRLK